MFLLVKLRSSTAGEESEDGVKNDKPNNEQECTARFPPGHTGIKQNKKGDEKKEQ